MPRKKKLPWNHGLKIPGYGDTPPHVVGPPIDTLTVGHSTPGAPPAEYECLRCEQLRDGEKPTVPDHALRCPYRGTGRDPESGG